MSDRSTAIVAPLARWSSRIALFSASVLVVGVVLHRLTPFPTPVAINLFRVCLAGAGLAILVGLIAFIQIWRRGYGGAGSAAVGILLPLVLLAWPLTYVPAFLNLPPINDVTHRSRQSAAVRGAGQAAQRAANPVAYPGQRFAPEQQKAYPDLRTFVIDRSVAGNLRAGRGRRAQAQVAGCGQRAAGRAAGQRRHDRGHRQHPGRRLHRRHRHSRGGQRQSLAHRRALRLAPRPARSRPERHTRAPLPGRAAGRIESTSPARVAGRRGLRTTRAGAAVKKLKESDRQKAEKLKAESRSGRVRVQSSAQRERAPKETPR